MTSPTHISCAEAASRLGISLEELFRMIDSGELPAQKTADLRVVVDETDLAAT